MILIGIFTFEIARHPYCRAHQRPTRHEWARDLPRPAKPMASPFIADPFSHGGRNA